MSTFAARLAQEAAQRNAALAFLARHANVWSTDGLNRVNIDRRGTIDLLVLDEDELYAVMRSWGLTAPPTADMTERHHGLITTGTVEGIDIRLTAYWRRTAATA
jgi:hypothetical protein